MAFEIKDLVQGNYIKGSSSLETEFGPKVGSQHFLHTFCEELIKKGPEIFPKGNFPPITIGGK